VRSRCAETESRVSSKLGLMSTVTTGVGLISGINTSEIIDALINAQRASVARLESRQKNYESSQLGLKALEATLLSVKTSADTLSKAATFGNFGVNVSDTSVLSATARSNATLGTTTLQVLQRSSAHTLKSRGFSSADQVVGAGTITIARGGEVDTATSLSLLNGGNGVRLGTIRVTDRIGATTDVDLSTARTVADVVNAINASGSAVQATARGDRLVLTDTSGGTGNLSVRDVGSGQTAADLGIAASVASSTLSGTSIYSVSESFSLSQINDGNPPGFSSTGADLGITLSDGSTLNVELSDATTLGGVLEAINAHADNGGKLVASLANGRLVLEDTTGGAGTLAVADHNGSKVVQALGLDAAPSGSTLTGKALTGGLNSVLLRNLRGGNGITQLGQISLTDRTGATATIDLSSAETLDDVLSAINAATTSGGQKLAITASVEAAGLGIELKETSGATSSNLIVSDVGGSTLATDLKIAVDSATTSVRSGHLGRRYISESTSLATYGANGAAVRPGTFQITDSSGTVASINISKEAKTIGEVIDKINAASVNVTARLNDTGDGIVLIDEAGGTGTLVVSNLGSSKTATDLKIAGTGVAGSDGKLRIDGRQSLQITLDADDTLSDLQVKLASADASLSASIFSDGSPVNPNRLLISSTKTGAANRLRIDDGGIGLGLSTVVQAQDALLRVGNDPATGVLLASSTNSFSNVPGGIDVDVLRAGTGPVDVAVDRDLSAVQNGLKQFVAAYNQYFDTNAELTKFDPATNQRGILQGDGTVTRVRARLDSLLSGRYGTDGSVSSLADVGITYSATGKLVLDEEKLAKVLAEQPDAAKAFFTDRTKGFAVKAKATLDSLTDPFTGSFKLQDDALTDSITRIEHRVAQLDELLAARRDRLIRQFARMEEALNGLQSQQNALIQLANLAANNGK